MIGTKLGEQVMPQHFLALAHELAGRGHRVVIVTTSRKCGSVSGLDTSTNPAVYSWPSERPTRLQDALFLHRLIRRHRPSCLIGNFTAVNLMTVIGWMTRVPCRVNWYHSLERQGEIDSGRPAWFIRLQQMRKRIVYRLTTHLVPVSQAASRDVQSVFGVSAEKCRVMYNSLPAPPLPSGPRALEQGLIVCVGRLLPSKGQDVLIRALAILQDHVPQARLELIGGGTARNTYERLAEDLGVADRCRFLGEIGHAGVLERMAAAAVTVVPSRSEAFGLVVIESMAAGTPVIASHVDGPAEILRDGADGFLVPPDDPDALAGRLRAVLTDSSLRERMAVSARESFLMHFERQRAVRDQADWLEGICRN